MLGDPSIRDEALPAFLEVIAMHPAQQPLSNAKALPKTLGSDVPMVTGSQMSTAPPIASSKATRCSLLKSSLSTKCPRRAATIVFTLLRAPTEPI